MGRPAAAAASRPDAVPAAANIGKRPREEKKGDVPAAAAAPRGKVSSKRPRDAEGRAATRTHDAAAVEPHVAEAPSEPASSAAPTAEPQHRPRVLILGTRGMTARSRHLLDDLRALVPHHKKDAKLDSKDAASSVREIAATKTCTGVVFLEVRAHTHIYMWLGRAPAGPTVKFHVVNVHTLEEMRMTGNCLKGSRPILSFDAAFNAPDAAPELAIMRDLLAHTFATPRGHPRSQPFHDHVLHFGWAAGRVWMRHYQLLDAADGTTSLLEIGPRAVLQPVRIFGGCMGGPTLWSNPQFVTPTDIRKNIAMAKARKFTNRQMEKAERRARMVEQVMEPDPVNDVFRDEVDE